MRRIFTAIFIIHIFLETAKRRNHFSLLSLSIDFIRETTTSKNNFLVSFHFICEQRFLWRSCKNYQFTLCFDFNLSFSLMSYQYYAYHISHKSSVDVENFELSIRIQNHQLSAYLGYSASKANKNITANLTLNTNIIFISIVNRHKS